jgi:UDP-2,3-diacylglucosamine pyrophosphatase LpxH
MSVFKRLTEVFESSKEISIDNSSKIILMSDIHRGNNSWSDNFGPNMNIYFTAINHYYNEGFTYIEVGDGDELWENRKFSEIRATYSPVFELLRKFFNKNRLHFIYGNHDAVKKNKNYVKENLYHYYDEHTQKYEPLFENIQCHEGLILRYLDNKIFVVHGHQGDLLNDTLWRIAQFLCRYLWRPLEMYLGFKDFTSPARNNKKKKSTEKKIMDWARINNQMIITGHTHRPTFPISDDCLYFNIGSCVHPRSITGIEIENGEITLVKWSIKVNASHILYVDREKISDSQKLEHFFNCASNSNCN